MKTSKKGKNEPNTASVSGAADKEILEVTVAADGGSKVKPGTKKADSDPKKPIAKKVKVKAEKKPSVEGAKPSIKKQKTSSAIPPAKKTKAASATSPTKKTKRAKPADVSESTRSSEHISDLKMPEPVDPLASMSPVDRLLAMPALPVLERENRARLLMQSPTKLHFYWSVRENPWPILRKAFGGEIGSYTLVLKLVEMRSGSEQIHNAEADGSWWFDVRPDSKYRAEIGFYAPNRPYIRIVYSNVIKTPRLKPSPHKAADSDWTVSAQKFARVLDVAGYARDAFDVAVAGDDPAASATAARQALRQFANGRDDRLGVIDDEDIRFAMMAFAEGQKLDDLRWKISAELFEYLQSSHVPLDAERAESALREHFDLDDVDLETEETSAAVFGASLVNFPRKMSSRRRPRIAGLSPEGSHNYGRTPRS